MSSYAVVDGFNNSGTVVPFDPEPACPEGIRYPEVTYSGRGAKGFLGFPVARLVWNNLEDRADASTLLALCGLSLEYGSEVTSNEVTVRLKDWDDTFITVNAVANVPDGLRRLFALGWSNLEIEFIIKGTAS